MSAAVAEQIPAHTAPSLLRRAAVLGAGAMGSRIAAHLANAGVPVLLLDIVPPGNADAKARSSIATGAIAALLKAKPAAFYDAASARLITPGNFEDDLAGLKECDWIIEAVTEDLAIKQALLAKIAPHVGAQSVVTTNTSGLPVASIAANAPAEFRRRWFGTHFFNPPRYMRLLEIIPTTESRPGLRCNHRRVRRPAAGQVHRLCAGHTELHRQPHRSLLHADRRAPDAGTEPYD